MAIDRRVETDQQHPDDSGQPDRSHPRLDRLMEEQARQKRHAQKGAIQQEKPPEKIEHEAAVHAYAPHPIRN